MESDNTAAISDLTIWCPQFISCGLELLDRNLFKYVCFVMRREKVAGADCAFVFAAGTSDVWLYKHPALWADETAAKCVQLFCRN